MTVACLLAFRCLIYYCIVLRTRTSFRPLPTHQTYLDIASCWCQSLESDKVSTIDLKVFPKTKIPGPPSFWGCGKYIFKQFSTNYSSNADRFSVVSFFKIIIHLHLQLTATTTQQSNHHECIRFQQQHPEHSNG